MESAHFFQTAILATYPQPDAVFFMTSTSICSMRWTWVSDASTRCLHLFSVADRREHKARAYDVAARQPSSVGSGVGTTGCAARSDAAGYWCQDGRLAGVGLCPTPTAVGAGRSGFTTSSTAMVHGASLNVDSAPRMAFVITFTAAGVEVGLPERSSAQKRHTTLS